MKKVKQTLKSEFWSILLPLFLFAGIGAITGSAPASIIIVLMYYAVYFKVS